ncbi:Efflux pump [Lachnellula subtilissima]|uniref:Efflux pump n=1 Tax=Lachnellula subtilissima TaxID=602034 RepID=A0A8H8RHH9_9HELO|nr:Efflux pump [Lachnellula subtilissima]
MMKTEKNEGSHPQNDVAAEIDPEKQPDSSSLMADPGQPAPDYEYITGVKLWLVFISVTLTVFLLMVDESIISPCTVAFSAIPQITSDFHALSDVGWYGSAYLLSICVLQPLTGNIYSQFSSKYSFLCFLAVFELGSVLCGAARSSTMLIIGRAVAGMGGSGLTNGAFTIIGASVPMEKQPAMQGIMISISQSGIVIAPMLGGALAQYSTWRWCFYLNLPIGGVAALLLLLIKLPDRIDRTNNAPRLTIIGLAKKLDVVGFLIFAPAIVMLLMALRWGGTEYPWKSATIIGLFCGAGITLIPFVIWEYYVGDNAMIPVSIVSHRVVWSGCIYAGLFLGAVMTFTYYMPIYFQAVRGISPSLSGVYMLPSIPSQMIAAAVSGVIAGKIHYYYPFSMVSGIFVAIGSDLLSMLSPSTPSSKWIGYQILLGIGRGFGIPMPIVAVQNILPPQQNPIGIALIVFSQTLGGSVFLAFAQTIFSHSLITNLARYAPIVSAHTVQEAGAAAISHVVDPQDLPGVLKVYQRAAASAATFFLAFAMGLNRISKKEGGEVEE